MSFSRSFLLSFVAEALAAEPLGFGAMVWRENTHTHKKNWAKMATWTARLHTSTHTHNLPFFSAHSIVHAQTHTTSCMHTPTFAHMLSTPDALLLSTGLLLAAHSYLQAYQLEKVCQQTIRPSVCEIRLVGPWGRHKHVTRIPTRSHP